MPEDHHLWQPCVNRDPVYFAVLNLTWQTFRTESKHSYLHSEVSRTLNLFLGFWAKNIDYKLQEILEVSPSGGWGSRNTPGMQVYWAVRAYETSCICFLSTLLKELYLQFSMLILSVGYRNWKRFSARWSRLLGQSMSERSVLMVGSVLKGFCQGAGKGPGRSWGDWGQVIDLPPVCRLIMLRD